MANYRAGDVIRLTRNAIGMTQEQLSEEICSVETLSRIENNRQGIGKDVYERLMAKMERNPLRSYAICSSVDMKIAEEKQALEDAVAKYDYVDAQIHLQALKEIIPDSKYNRQYISRLEAVISFNMHQIDVQELIERLQEVVCITVPDIELYISEMIMFPFTQQEVFALMSLANAYGMLGQREKSIQVYQMLLLCLNEGYMDRSTETYTRLVLEANRAKTIGDMGQHKQALIEIDKSLKKAISFDYGHIFPSLLLSKAWNMLQENPDKNEKKEIKKILRKAYYIAAARYDSIYMKIIRQYYENVYHENL